jgi:hypothetical protein
MSAIASWKVCVHRHWWGDGSLGEGASADVNRVVIGTSLYSSRAVFQAGSRSEIKLTVIMLVMVQIVDQIKILEFLD